MHGVVVAQFPHCRVIVGNGKKLGIIERFVDFQPVLSWKALASGPATSLHRGPRMIFSATTSVDNQADVSYSGNQLSAQPLSIEVFQGSVLANINALVSDRSPFNASYSVKHVDLGEVFRWLDVHTGVITGFLTMDVAIRTLDRHRNAHAGRQALRTGLRAFQ
jgi:hypothetical protein